MKDQDNGLRHPDQTNLRVDERSDCSSQGEQFFIYVLLIRSRTFVSKGIYQLTKEPYTHSSIAMDGDLRTLCSFARRFRLLPLPGGLVQEDIEGLFYRLNCDSPCLLLRFPVSKEAYQTTAGKIEEMMRERLTYSYAVRGLLACRRGVDRVYEKKFFCSHFVATMLHDYAEIQLPKPPALMHPEDFLKIPGREILFKGHLSQLRDQLASL